MIFAACATDDQCSIHVAYNQQMGLCKNDPSPGHDACRDPQNLCTPDPNFRFTFESSSSVSALPIPLPFLTKGSSPKSKQKNVSHRLSRHYQYPNCFQTTTWLPLCLAAIFQALVRCRSKQEILILTDFPTCFSCLPVTDRIRDPLLPRDFFVAHAVPIKHAPRLKFPITGGPLSLPLNIWTLSIPSRTPKVSSSWTLTKMVH